MTATTTNETMTDLRAAAAEFDAAAARAFTVIDHEQRQQDARTLRTVIAMGADRRAGTVDQAWMELWLEASRRLLAYYDRMDMDVVHGSRMVRREARQRQLDAEAGR